MTTLDEAWQAAEDALPEGWANGPTLFGYDVQDGGRFYIASVDAPVPFRAYRRLISGEADSPTAALLALAAKLKEPR